MVYSDFLHLPDLVLVGCVFLGVDNIFSLGYLIFWHTIVHSTGMDGACSFLVRSIMGEAGAITVRAGDSYYAFKKQLDRFVDFLRTGEPDHSFLDTIEMAQIIAAGIKSREEGGRKVYLSEIALR